MLNTFLRSWPGWNGEDGIVGAVDSLCKINGPRGLGSAVTYSSSNSAWDVTDNVTKLAGGSPDSTDVGRIWNEGLAFYGWLFYLSKFYEVVDTFIVLAKGKKSSFLQTYHHAGAMMCMWAGIRYMSSPIWMFVFVNSAIHTLMVCPRILSWFLSNLPQYFYYTLSALTVQVPSGLKRVITFLQISQFVFGSTYALAHLFLAYTIPAQVPYLFSHNLSTALSSVPSLTSILPTATATANMGALLKKIALRAAGEEGLAQNVRNNAGEMFGIDAVHAAEVEKAQEEIRYRLEYRTVNCIDTSGQVFAIWLNIMYLAPLTYLFADFFARSYLRRTSDKTPNTAHKHAVEESSRDAAEGVEREIHEAMGTDQETAYSEIPADVKTNIEYLKEEVRKDVSQLSEKARTEVFELSEKARHAITRSDSAVEVKTEVTETEAGESSTREHDGGPDVDGDGEQQLDDSLGALDESAYEFNLDEAKSDEEMKAEGEMQPDGVAFGTMS